MYGLVRAPEIDRAGLTWFNVNEPLTLSALSGRLVILDFWTFCCINCLHVVPTLRRLEEAFPDELVVIGVHSPKFSAEREPANLGHAIARCDVRHPVIHDPEMVLWDEYCVRAWPTLVLIGPDGRILGDITGEPDAQRLISGVGAMLHAWREQGLLSSPSPLPLALAEAAGGSLRYPGKIKPLRARDGSKLWALADSGHHQIVVFDDHGSEVRRFGSGEPGFIDSDAETAAFCNPQGLICHCGAIYVADTGNHAIRRIDLCQGETVTLAGTGERGRALHSAPAAACETALASVWDLELAGDKVFFANAGTHQLGELNLEAMTVRSLAGTSGEDIVDGPAMDAQLAQPSGLALGFNRQTLYFADSETSAIRSLSLCASPHVETLVGSGLFDFGHANGCFGEARLQHPLGLVWCNGQIVVADSFNGRLRVLDLDRSEVRDLDEGGFDSEDDATLPAGEPAGVTADGPERLLVADTNNHRIVEIRPEQRTLRTWAR